MIFLILGTRSEVIKLSSLIRELIKRKITFKTIHTGQHDTLNLMKSLELPEPDYYLGKSLRKQWSKSRIAPILALIWGASVFLKLRKIFQRDKPGIILYNGNTMAVPLACFAARSILFYKPLLVHRESGLRANSIRGGWLDPLRKTGEYFGNILFTPSKQALISLKNQYNNKKIVYTGDAKFEIINQSLKIKNTQIREKKYVLVNTRHCIKNRNDAKRFIDILLNIPGKVICCINPSIKSKLINYNLLSRLENSSKINIKDSLNYLVFLNYIKNANIVLTDSQGVIEESLILNVPCISLNNYLQFKEFKEFTEVYGLNKKKILRVINNLKKGTYNKVKETYPFGDGKATKRIVDVLEKHSLRSKKPRDYLDTSIVLYLCLKFQ